MQKDLLIAVKVANDFKMEAQKEMLKLSDKITELQRRRQSAAFTVHKGSSVILSKKNIQSWEDEAWQRLMLGCERGLFFSVLYFFLLLCFLKKNYLCVVSGSRRNTLLRWCQEAVAKYSHVEITNFSSSWADGRALCCLLASFYPDKLNMDVSFLF